MHNKTQILKNKILTQKFVDKYDAKSLGIKNLSASISYLRKQYNLDIVCDFGEYRLANKPKTEEECIDCYIYDGHKIIGFCISATIIILLWAVFS